MDQPASAAAELAEAERAAGAGRLAEARATYERILPDLVTAGAPGPVLRASGGLAAALIGLGEPAQALAALDATQAQAEDAPPAARAILDRLRGQAHMTAGRPQEALAAYEDALRFLPDARAPSASALADIYNLLGEAAGALGRFDLAEPWQRGAVAALRAGGTNGLPLALALTNLGVSAFRNGRADEAEDALREALALAPDLLLASENLIHVLYKRERIAEARILAEDKYRKQSFVVHPPPPGRSRGTLLLLWSFDGTVPHAHLLAGLPTQRIDWHIEFAAPSHEAALPPYGLVLNLIGDPEDGAAALKAARAFRPRAHAPMLNDPARIADTGRDNTARLLRGIDVRIPAVARLAGAALRGPDAEAALARAGLALPVLLRRAGTHGGESVVRVETSAALAETTAGYASDAAVFATEYVDYVSPDAYFRKYRAIFIGGEPYPYHLAVSPHWLVHYFSAEMEDNAAKLEEELRYLENMEAALGPRASSALRAIGARMGLDYCGIDFSLMPDGRVLLFECNATMLVHPEPDTGPTARKNPFIRNIIDAFQKRITDFLARPDE